MGKKITSTLVIGLLGLSFSLGAFGKTVEAASYTSEMGIEFVGKMPATSQGTPDGKTPVSKNVISNQNRLPQTGEIKGSGLSMIGLILLSTAGLIGWVKYNDSKQSK